MYSQLAYHCDCGCGVLHKHEVDSSLARNRGLHFDILAAKATGSDVASPQPPSTGGVAAAAQEHKRRYYNGAVTGYTTVNPDAAVSHPDSWKYFQRCKPEGEPIPAIFEGDGIASSSDGSGVKRASLWATPGTNYHATLPAGDNTLTARLAGLVAASVVDDGGFDAQAYFRRYVTLLAGQELGPELAEEFLAQGVDVDSSKPPASANDSPSASPSSCDPRSLLSHNNDCWVDESHRVLMRNMARAGAAPWEAGLDDCCLTGIALSVPLLLTYAGNRDAQEAAVRSLLQLTHKSEDMVRQVLYFGDLLSLLLSIAAAAASDSDNPPSSPISSSIHGGSGGGFSVPDLLARLCTSYSDGKLDLPVVLANFSASIDPSSAPGDPSAPDSLAFFGPHAVFSVR